MRNILQNKLLLILLIFIIIVTSIVSNCYAETTYTFTSPDGENFKVEIDFDDPILPKNYAYFVSLYTPSSTFYDTGYLGSIYVYDRNEAELKVEKVTPSEDGANILNLWLYRKSDGKKTNNDNVGVNIYSISVYIDGVVGNWNKLNHGYYGVSFSDKQSRSYILLIYTFI